ncbi:MAG TPA: transporter substrate-binding domain-containing protein [Burkholderiales bacterium]|nr:transporter substrate-binding domain-containing protein [Burkholderiales bacterium]
MRLRMTMLMIAALALFCGPAFGQPKPSFPPGSLGDKIVQRGFVIVGVRYDIPLYGFQNPKSGQVEGFEVDIAKELARSLFGAPDKLELRQVVSRTRIPMLQEGVVDVVIANLTQTKARMQEIDFTDLYNLAGMQAMVADSSPIKTLADLKTATIAVAKGGTGEQAMHELYPEAKLIQLDSHGDSFQALVSRRATVFVADDTTLQGMQEKLKGFRVIPERLTFEPHAMGVAKGHPEWVAYLNSFITELKSSGKWKELYRKNVGESTREPPPGKPDPKWLR